MAKTAAKFAVDMNGITQITNFLTHGIQAFPLAWEWLLRRDEQSAASNAAWAAGRFFNDPFHVIHVIPCQYGISTIR
ncbi:hypothetical protein PHLGIDRAFT_120428 [Phlebiopsis gigantea 11061_1 CR5-6]|uniref:Uncharacterized protein n=1 Tax=Phlebiopsis gigantea (strain 11061_1 CR5-6) TaxID=745531 RepID=A0A0C3PGD6_PHLG1|nr:hypothetical protein PHLGIDRAFT_120428 [Phlebiopsis gigantea 11061_1 CR5-6]